MRAALACAGAPAVPAPEVDEPARSGRVRVERALDPPPPRAGPIGRSGLLSTGVSSASLNPIDWLRRDPLKSLDPAREAAEHLLVMELADGTRVAGTLYRHRPGEPGPWPLLIASFGFLQDFTGSEAAKFKALYIEDPERRIPAHVLFLDHPSAGSFLALNGYLSVGSYDDARMWMEVARVLRRQMEISAVHLLGVSMSGQSVVHALAEDARRGTQLFASGLAVSIAPDFREAPGRQLARMPTRPGVANPWRRAGDPAGSEGLSERAQDGALRLLLGEQFPRSYRSVRRDSEVRPARPLPGIRPLLRACSFRV